jgi:hypothetical protein
MITYNTFIQRFKDFADNHYFIRSFSHGAPEDVDLEKFNEYPLMHVIYTGASYEDTTKTLSFEVYIFDLPSHYENKQDRQKEVVSDAEQCAEDVIADIVNGGNIFVHEEDYTVQTARVTPLQEESSNVLAGVLLEVDIQIPYDRDACNAPIDGVSPEGGEIVYARRGVLRVRTVNSSTDVLSVRTIVVPNGSLMDDGGGQVTLNISGAAVASVTGTAPIVSSGGTTPAISITAASTSAAGSMSASDKTKLDGIAAGAEVNVNADWNAVSGDAQILNKPTLATVATTGSYTDLIDKPTIVSSVTGTAPIVSSGGTTPAISISAATTSAAGSMSSADKVKLDGIAAGAEVNVNADWNAVSGDAQILNKPTIVSAVTGTAPIVSSGGTSPAISITAATTGAAGSMSAADKSKLNGIAAGAEVNQNAFSNFQVGATTIAADTKTDTLTLIAGANVTLTPDAANDTITIAASGGGGGSDSFNTIAVSGQFPVIADSGNDTLTLVAGANMTLTTNPTTDSVTFAVSGLAAVATSGSYADLSGTPARFFVVKPATGTPYTLGSGDAGYYLRLSHTSKITLDIPLGTFALNDEVLIEQSGAGKIEIVPASGVTLLNTSQYLSVTFGQYAIIGIKCVSNNTYVVTGEREPV